MSVELREVSTSSSMATVKVNDKAVLASTALAVKLPSPQQKTWTEQTANKKQSPPLWATLADIYLRLSVRAKDIGVISFPYNPTA